MTLNSKQLKKVALALIAVGALRELRKQEPYLSATKVAARKRELKEQINDLIDFDKKESSDKLEKVTIQVNLPGQEVKAKETTLKGFFTDLFGREEKKTDLESFVSTFLEENDDEDVIIGKIVKEL